MQRQVAPNGLGIGHGGTPDGPPVVFVHGAMDRGAAFLRVARLLPETSWWVYDRRGYGRSADAGTTDFEGHVGDLVEILEHVRSSTGSAPVLVGHSLGGTIALTATYRRPDLVAALATYEAALSWAPWWEARYPLLDPPDPDREAERFLRRILGDERWLALPAATRERRRRDGQAYVAEFGSARRQEGFAANEIAVPVLLAHGTSTGSAQPARAAEEMVAELRHGRRVVFEGAPHGAHLSHPAEMADLVRQALAAATNGRPAGQ
ncbi:MAG TPA: alpha/beta hydrolase [Acidimicrobiales bacterium]